MGAPPAGQAPATQQGRGPQLLVPSPNPSPSSLASSPPNPHLTVPPLLLTAPPCRPWWPRNQPCPSRPTYHVSSSLSGHGQPGAPPDPSRRPPQTPSCLSPTGGRPLLLTSSVATGGSGAFALQALVAARSPDHSPGHRATTGPSWPEPGPLRHGAHCPPGTTGTSRGCHWAAPRTSPPGRQVWRILRCQRPQSAQARWSGSGEQPSDTPAALRSALSERAAAPEPPDTTQLLQMLRPPARSRRTPQRTPGRASRA